MPGCLGGRRIIKRKRFYLAWAGYEGEGRARGVGDVRFFGEVLPEAKTVRFHLHIKRVILKDIVLGIADGEVFVDDEQIYSAKNIKTGLIPVSGQNTVN